MRISVRYRRFSSTASGRKSSQGSASARWPGVFIADGKRPEEVLELFMSREFRSFTGFTRSRGGFMNLDNFYGFLRDTLSVGRIEELSLPLAVTATNLDTGGASTSGRGR